MLPGAVLRPMDAYMNALNRVAPQQVAAVYAVGGLALSDFSPKQSNVDLVVVADPPLGADEVARLAPAERALRRAGRQAEVWYSGWEEVAAAEGDLTGSSPLATPMTRALLRQDPMALLGPDWPVVGFDAKVFQAWCLERLRALAARRKGLLLLRRAVTPLVLEAARLAQGSITGRLFSKSEAGESAGMLVSARYRRILTDAVGYRRGAQTSMYWGPFERKYDALILIRDLLDAAGGP